MKEITGINYRKWIANVHASLDINWYLEVGCRRGLTFSSARCNTIAVDPEFKLESNVLNLKKQLHLFQVTSDEFFESSFMRDCRVKIDIAFLDGMHLMEYLLRDFINTEKNCHAGSVIMMHDCYPSNAGMVTRDLKKLPKSGAWTGDVYKLVKILNDYRPDLSVVILDLAPTGLVLVSGLEPSNSYLQRNYNKILNDFIDVGWDEMSKFMASVDLVAASDYLPSRNIDYWSKVGLVLDV